VAEDTEKQEGFFRQAGAVVSAAYNAAMKGGELQAAFRQGANELGAALNSTAPGWIAGLSASSFEAMS
jgi:hypothetical protein